MRVTLHEVMNSVKPEKLKNEDVNLILNFQRGVSPHGLVETLFMAGRQSKGEVAVQRLCESAGD